MNFPRVQKRILLYVILPGCVIYFGLHFYAQYRHVNVYVMRSAPMPAELASGLHMEEHKIDPTVTIESPYETAADKILSPAELGRVRSAIAWNSEIPAFPCDLFEVHRHRRSRKRCLVGRDSHRVCFGRCSELAAASVRARVSLLAADISFPTGADVSARLT